tara:strand:- start:2891 stop:3187 length:297 start_codon:yes stop_codon:yes gene_type:complete
MGFISALVALLRAVPSLERLFLKVSDGVREAKAKERFNAKLNHIDDAIAAARSGVNGGMLHSSTNEWSEDPDRSPPVPEGGTISATVDESGTGEGSRA